MAKTKVSEWDSTPGNNTDIDSINIAEGCAPSGINNAIRELMSQVKDFQQGTYSDPFNGPVNGTIGATTASSGAFTTLAASSTVTLSGGTANGVAYLNGSKVLTSGSALTFDGTNLGVPRILQSGSGTYGVFNSSGAGNAWASYQYNSSEIGEIGQGSGIISGGSNTDFGIRATNNLVFAISYNEQMRLTSTGLGIGTSSPNEKLVVNGAVRSSSNAVSVTASAGAVMDYFSGMARFFATDGSAVGQMNLDKAGNLGLGVTPSAWSLTGLSALQIKAASMHGYDSECGLTANGYYAGGWRYIGSTFATQYLQSGGVHRWYTAPSGTAGSAISFTQAMTLTSGGDLGVGTTSPAYKLHAAEDSSGGARLRLENLRTATFDGDFFGQIQFFGNDSNGSGIRAAVTALCRDVSGATDLTFATAPSGGSYTERARIDSSGNLLVNSTSISNSPARGVQLWSGSSNSIGGIAIGHDTGVASGNYFAVFNYASGIIGSIAQSGTTAVLYNVTSDQRLKENIVDAPEFGGVIDSIKVRSYDWKVDGNHQRAGFIAQELVTVAPEAVHQPSNPDDMMAVDYSKLVPMLVKEIQSLRKRLAAAGIA